MNTTHNLTKTIAFFDILLLETDSGIEDDQLQLPQVHF